MRVLAEAEEQSCRQLDILSDPTTQFHHIDFYGFFLCFMILYDHLFLVIPVSDGAHHPALWPERASVLDVKGLSRHQTEVKPLEQLGHHHFRLHL